MWVALKKVHCEARGKHDLMYSQSQPSCLPNSHLTSSPGRQSIPGDWHTAPKHKFTSIRIWWSRVSTRINASHLQYLYGRTICRFSFHLVASTIQWIVRTSPKSFQLIIRLFGVRNSTAKRKLRCQLSQVTLMCKGFLRRCLWFLAMWSRTDTYAQLVLSLPSLIFQQALMNRLWGSRLSLSNILGNWRMNAPHRILLFLSVRVFI